MRTINQDENMHRIHRHNYEDKFSIIPNHIFENPNLSWGAKGLLCYMLSRPKDWVIYRNQLASVYKGERSGNGKTAVDGAFKELIEQGYIVYTPKDEKTKKYIHRYDVYPEPFADFQKINPESGFLAMGNSRCGKTAPYTKKDRKPRNDDSHKKSSCCDSQAAQRVDEEKPKDPSIDKAELLARKIKANNPKAQIPEKIESWAKHIELMHRIDGYSYAEIEELIEFSQQDPFWSGNVLSALKLRKQAGTLVMRMKGNKGSKAKSIPKQSTELSGFREPTPEEIREKYGDPSTWKPMSETFPELFKKNE